MDYEFSYSFSSATVRNCDKKPYLYTFRNKRPLDKLIYLDGASAAKSTTGEMDQQLILGRQSNPDEPVNQYKTTPVICEWGRPFGLQGIVRLEIGFEVIICDFQRDLELISNITLSNFNELLPDKVNRGLLLDSDVVIGSLEEETDTIIRDSKRMGSYEWIQAGSRVNDGEPRIKLDFSKLVTPINKTWISSNPYHRRINNIPTDVKESIIAELENVFQKPVNPFHHTDWQYLTNAIVQKFSSILMNANITLALFESQKKDLKPAIKVAGTRLFETTSNFIRRYSDDLLPLDREAAFQTSIKDYIYNTYELTSSSEVLIHSSIYVVYTRIFHTVYDIYELSKNAIQAEEDNLRKIESELTNTTEALVSLIHELHWSIFTKCHSLCEWDEICYIPTWGPSPFGWGASDTEPWFRREGERFVIGNELSCVKYSDFPLPRPFSNSDSEDL